MWDTVARNTLEQGLWDTPELTRLFNNQPVLGTCCPVFEQNTLAVKYDQVINTAHKASVEREPRVADPQKFARLEWATVNPRVADGSVPAAHLKLVGQGIGELGDQRSAAASLLVRLQPLR